MSDRGLISSRAEDYTGVENLEVMRDAINYNAFLADLIEQAVPRSGTIVDFGAGSGTFAHAMRARGHAPVCVELDNSLRQRLLRDGFQAHESVESLQSASVDGAYTLNVLEHIEDDQSALNALASKLKPGAPLLVYVPAFPVLFTSMDVNVGHVRRYVLDELVGRMQKAGVVIERAEYVDSLGFFATLAFKWFGDAKGQINRRALVIYDRFVFPLSRALDWVFRRWFGKNVLVVGRRAQ